MEVTYIFFLIIYILCFLLILNQITKYVNNNDQFQYHFLKRILNYFLFIYGFRCWCRLPFSMASSHLGLSMVHSFSIPLFSIASLILSNHIHVKYCVSLSKKFVSLPIWNKSCCKWKLFVSKMDRSISEKTTSCLFLNGTYHKFFYQCR